MARIEIPTTISGDIVTAENATTRNAIALSVGIDPVQDLHGQANPYPAGEGKNKMPVYASGSATSGECTITTYADGSVKITGTSNGNPTVWLGSDGTFKAGQRASVAASIALSGTYILSGSNASPSFRIDIADATDGTYVQTGDGTVVLNGNYNIRIVGSNGVTYNTTVYPMIRLSTESDATFAPYENICPISGHTSAVVTRTGKNLLNIADYTSTSNARIVNTTGVYLKAGTYTVSFDYSTTATEKRVQIAVKKDSTIAQGNYTLTGNIASSLVTCTEGRNQATLVCPQEGYLYMRLVGNGASVSNIQAELSSSATAYEAPQIQQVTIELDGTRYGGSLNVLTGEMTVTWKMYIYNGTESWEEKPAASGGVPYFRCTANYSEWLYPLPAESVANENFLCNVGVCHRFQWIDGGNYGVVIGNGLRISFEKQNPDVMTVSQFQTWLATNNIQLLAVLATPITVQLSPSQLAMLEGTNVLWSDTGNIEKLTYYRSVEMALNTMYPAKNGSPKTTLAQDITAAATSMVLADVSVLPPAPNLAVLGEEETAEIVLYNEISGNVVSGMIRGINGTTASVWTSGTSVARNFTSYDHDTIIENFLILDNEKAPLASPALTGTPTAPTASSGTNTTQLATTAFVNGELSGAIAKEVMYFTNQTVSVASSAQIMRIPSSGTNSNITTNTVVLECSFANPAAITSNVAWTSYAGYITFSGTCTSATTANVTLGTKGN